MLPGRGESRALARTAAGPSQGGLRVTRSRTYWMTWAWGEERTENASRFLTGVSLADGTPARASKPRWEQRWARMNLASNPADTAGWAGVPKVCGLTGHLQTHCCQLTILVGFLPGDPSAAHALTKELGSRHELTLQIREPQCSLLADFPGPVEGADRWGSPAVPPHRAPREGGGPGRRPSPPSPVHPHSSPLSSLCTESRQWREARRPSVSSCGTGWKSGNWLQ